MKFSCGEVKSKRRSRQTNGAGRLDDFDRQRLQVAEGTTPAPGPELVEALPCSVVDLY